MTGPGPAEGAPSTATVRLAPKVWREPVAWWACLALLCAALVAPLAVTDVPPLLDYPNHLARAFLLAQDGRDPILAGFAEPAWGIIPDLALDAVLPPLIRILPVDVAGRIVVGAFVLLPVAGAIAFSGALFKRRSWWSLAAGLVAYNATSLMGFLNFTAGLGVALLVAAVWVRWRESAPWRTTGAVAIGLVVTFFCHLMGLAFAVGLIGVREIDRAWRPGGRAIRLLPLAAVLAGPVVLYALSPLASAQGPLAWTTPGRKLSGLLVAFTNYDATLDLVTALAVLGFLALLIAARRATLPRVGWLAIAGVTVGYAAAPYAYKGTFALDTRLVVMAGLLMFACVRPRLSGRQATLAGLAFAALFVVRQGVLAEAWAGRRADLRDLRAVIADVPAGARVFPARVTPEEAPAYWRRAPASRRLSDGMTTEAHLVALLLTERRAFWPDLFQSRSQQPIAYRPPYLALSRQITRDRSIRPFLTGERVGTCGYDFVLILDAGGLSDPARLAPARLDIVRANDFAALYRIRQPDPECAPATAAREPVAADAPLLTHPF